VCKGPLPNGSGSAHPNPQDKNKYFKLKKNLLCSTNFKLLSQVKEN
jgi:hypothetical protein